MLQSLQSHCPVELGKLDTSVLEQKQFGVTQTFL